MSLHAIPMIIINLGCEMVYILEQRLKAQEVAADKSRKVLHDVVRTMFGREFMAETFRPKEAYSCHATRKVFDKIAHSSIMRLSEVSMDKLYDLMVMGLKYQVLCSERLDQLLEVTIRHLDEVRAMVSERETVSLVQAASDRVHQVFGAFTAGQWLSLRHTICSFFHERRVKVSLFLQEGIQGRDGFMFIRAPKAPLGEPQVGTVQVYAPGGVVKHEQVLPMAALDYDPNEFFCHPDELGVNLYDKMRMKAQPPPRHTRDSDGGAAKVPLAPSKRGPCKVYANEVLTGSSTSEASKEIGLLSSLLNNGLPSAPSADTFKLTNLFGDAELDIDSEPEDRLEPVKTLSFGAKGSKNQEALKSIAEVMKDLDLEAAAPGGEGGDLLDLLDQAK